jgi:hypothetical protein
MTKRQERLNQYSNPTSAENWCGEATKEYIDRWSARAHANSFNAKDAGAKEKSTFMTDAKELDHAGSDFMPKVRRNNI